MNSDDTDNPTNLMQGVLLGSNVPVAGPGRTGGGGVVPPVLLEENRVPKFYHEAIIACGATTSNSLPNTALVYNMMVTSGLPRPVLSYVWSAVNRTLPGQLTRPEFFSCLALIALAQKNETIAAISSMSQLPIPFLQPVQVQPQLPQSTNFPTPSSSASSFSKAPSNVAKGYFLPTSLLPSPKRTLAKSKDLIGDFFGQSSSKSNSTIKKDINVPASHEYNADLSSIDWSGNSSSLKLESKANEESSEMVKYRQSVWIKTLTAVSQLFEVADKLFSSSSIECLGDLFKTERGSMYLISLSRAYGIIERVKLSASGMSVREMEERLHNCCEIWSKLSVFMPSNKPSVNPENRLHCGICGQSTVNAVEYGGKHFHPECANLWVNCIDPILPAD